MTLEQLRDTIDEYLKNNEKANKLPIAVHANSNNFQGEYKNQNFIRIFNTGTFVLIDITVSKRTYEVFCNDGYKIDYNPVFGEMFKTFEG